MSTFTLKCPGCGILLEAEENDVGATVECEECGKEFVLAKEVEKTKNSVDGTYTFSFDKPANILDYEKQLADLLQANFANGVRPDSAIDQKKLRNLYQRHFAGDLPSAFDFATILSHIGIVFEGKVYPKPTTGMSGWHKLIERLVAEGHTLFQFSRLMETHSGELLKFGIKSWQFLQEIVRLEDSDSFDISGEIFAPKGGGEIHDRLTSAFTPKEGAIVDILATSKRLPYISVTFIRNWFKSCNLVRIGPDMYAMTERVEFDDFEIERGKTDCEKNIANDKFFLLSQLRLANSTAMNDPRMTDKAIRRVFYMRFLSGKFDIEGQVVCAKGAIINRKIPIHAFFHEHTDTTLDQLEAVAEEYHITMGQALEAAHEDMVRVNKDKFAIPSMVPFDTVAIDNAIAKVCGDNPMPLGAFGNFADFPAVPGWTWNKYLFEAFLRRSSAMFRFVSSSGIGKDVSGAVIPSNFSNGSPEVVFAHIALHNRISAEADDVGSFLIANHCIMRRTDKTLLAVVAKMKEWEKR